MSVSNDTMGFSERVLQKQRDRVRESNTFNNNESLVIFPKQSLYLNQLASLRDSLLVEQHKKLFKDFQRFRIAQQRTEEQMEKVRVEHQTRKSKLSRKTPMLFERLDHIRFEHPSQLSPLTTLVEGRNITRRSQQLKPYLPKRKKHATKLQILETVKLNLPRLPQNLRKSPIISLTPSKTDKRDPSVIPSQPLSRKLTPRSKQAKVTSTRSRLRPLLACTPRDRCIEQVKFEPVPDGDRMNIDQIFTECLTLYEDKNSYHQRLTLSTVRRQLARSHRGSNIGWNAQNIKLPPRLPKILYKSDSTLSVLNSNLNDNFQNKYNEGRHIEKQTFTSPCKQIIVAMPDIVLDNASPVPGTSRESSPTGSLSKTIKQSELRQREIKNLLEDVKELNKQTQQYTEENINLCVN
ncbi:hypothetical protein LOTGIDRAFT_174318 [Lottia gigantea]|uniref:Uncharacterized protein n=1 Tax=Lottia gigantea TaxID=225164 RepID=V4ALY8_LOTGI|nr:hypothetical protein LOTGIDRAFT_174318 [Lottia gigantea]ESO98142.1 hypothetical protein LOTGIDRAFT_174318 [Lottia gigantea]